MDIHNAQPKTDYLSTSSEKSLDPKLETAVHFARVTKHVTFSDDNDVGDLLYLLPLDTSLDPAAVQMAAEYERYSIKDLKIHVQATSPFGTSSGAMQAAFLPDPSNVNFTPAGSEENLKKAVRQSGSLLLRPRESAYLSCNLDGTLYTLNVGDERLWSFGAVAFILRSVPDAGDKVAFAITLTAAMHFERTAYVQTLEKAQDVLASPDKFWVDSGNIFAQFNYLPLSHYFRFRPTNPIKFLVEFMHGKTGKTKRVKHTITLGDFNFTRTAENHYIYSSPLNKILKTEKVLSASILNLDERLFGTISPDTKPVN